MKRILQHPEGPAEGRKYWRSLDELADSPKFHRWLETEFPAGASELEMDELTRRSFLRLMGGSLALAGLGMSGCRRPEGHLVPFTNSPEWMVPGKSLIYATAMPRRRGAVPIHGTSFEGRPTKLDGNSVFPNSAGTSDLFAQASILDLYDPDRARSFKRDGKKVDVAEFAKFLEQANQEFAAIQGAGLAFLFESSTSPTSQRLRAELKQKFPKATIAAYEALTVDNEIQATEIAFGQRYNLLPRYDKADVILSLECDFCSSEDGGAHAIRGYASRRRVRKTTDTMNRLYVVESRLSTTGGMADHRLRLKASKQGAFLAFVAKELVQKGVGTDLAAIATAVPAYNELKDHEVRWAREAAIDLLKYGKGLVVVGSQQPVAVQLLAIAINQALGAFKSTLDLIPAIQLPAASIRELATQVKAGEVKTLFVIGGNPAYNAPAELDWVTLQKSIPTVVRVASHDDETAHAKATWFAPLSHYLESWGDARAFDGTYLAIQPLVLPLFGGISEIEVLAAFLGNKEVLLPIAEVKPATFATPTVPGQASPVPTPATMKLVQETFVQISKASGAAAWTKFLHDGFWAGTASASANASLRAANVIAVVKDLPASTSGYEVTFHACPKLDDGRYANNGWLQELPEITTKLTWDNAALVSLATAKKLGIKIVEYPSMAVELSASEKERRTKNPSLEIDDEKADVILIEVDGRQMKMPVYVLPGQADDSIAIALGYGRKHCGQVGNLSGFSAYAIRTTQFWAFAPDAKITRANETYELAQTQMHHSMEGRALVREASLKEYQEQPNFVTKMGIDSHQPPLETLYVAPGTGIAPKLDAPHQWGMVIDLSTCVGCNACVIACQSENNIPIVGKSQVIRGRAMHWMRIDRYFSENPADPQTALQPLLCMHCENAPCETVCPVNATVHTEDGLNVMAYNRCIGTRYCANNCPYKVRRFNFFDYNKRNIHAKTKIGPFELGNLYLGPLGVKNEDEVVKMQKNPNVSVRMRGVMEKCSFCVQRIEESKIATLRKAKDSAPEKIPTDSLRVACQQACPAEAIVFGDISDAKSQVAQLKKNERNYGLLTYINTQPRVTYLARLRNPNPLMPDADKVGLGGDWDAYGHAGHHEGHDAHGSEKAHH